MIDVNLPVELDDGRQARYLTSEEAIEIGEAFAAEDYEDGVALFEIVGREHRYGSIHDNISHWWYELDTGCWRGGTAEEYYFLRNVTDDGDYEPDLV